MKKALLSMFLVLILSSCSIDLNNEKDEKIIKLEKQVEELKKDKENDLFKKKQECIKYKSDMLEMAQQFRSEIYEIEEIFYSDYGKSCFFIAKQSPYERLLFDYFSNLNIAVKGFSNRCEESEYCIIQANESDAEYERKLKELKGE
ncbi:MAG: hypothetical protein PHH98_01965 [Candidatus Gracilibacteria bacterium]|nr:hypothetical protein [Candidatus Gracilibacteria bacterium]